MILYNTKPEKLRSLQFNGRNVKGGNLYGYSKDSIISTVSIKRTVLRFSLMTLLNVPYDLDMAFLRFYCTVSIKRTVWVMPLLYILFACFKSIIFILSDKYKPNI